ncbi:nonsense-mediated mRNA decay factor SMG8-like [Ornithodoros turicata]|uniref:nonsense-mediated mRNA decay factor SMG8-like n=1 Tax=Ornithodoros turicata TaxID=34597 RepID=UPI003138E0A9
MARSSKTSKPPLRGYKFDVSNIEDALSDLTSVSKERVCIVSFIGKTALYAESIKSHLIDDVVGRNVLEPELGTDREIGQENYKIEGYYHPENRVIFLHLLGLFDTYCAADVCRRLEQELNEKSFLELWSSLQCSVAQTLLYLFHISHVVVIVHPTATFDVSYIHLFRTLDSIRQKCLSSVVDALKPLPISTDWVQNGRPCSPRVLFVFLQCPLEGNESELLDVRPKGKASKLSPIKKLEHSLEDQIYRILRKSRVITNISGNSLFAVPANQEFVYVRTSSSIREDTVDFFLKQLITFCSPDYEESLSDDLLALSLDPTHNDPQCQEHSFSLFLGQHVELALSKGFDDNVGRHPIPADFELPTISMWFKVATKLRDFFMRTGDSKSSATLLSSLRTALDIDIRFSEGRCGKVLPLASAAYQENLPPHYTAEYHHRKLAVALQLFSAHARGPAFQRYVQQLKEDCDAVWKAGRQMCEVLSLTGNHCVNPVHKTPESVEEDADEDVLVMPHCSQVKLISACNCGHQQGTRDDPFIVKAANYNFYMIMSAECCGELERITFPTFQPSSVDHGPAAPSAAPCATSELLEVGLHAQAKSHSRSQNRSQAKSGTPSDIRSPTLSESDSEFSSEPPESTSDSDETSSNESDSGKSLSLSGTTQHTEDPDEDDKYCSGDKEDVAPSCADFLPGMLHSQSPPGLLPCYSSWSLVCLGPSSLYSHSIGIQDQPGFITGTNFLLPWDVAVKFEKDRWPSLWEGKRPQNWKGKKNGKDGYQFTVKVFLGVEYECPRGHRFMCSSSDRILRCPASGLIKENAQKIANSHMPLYYPCPCRSGKPQVAQLMRVHVVTPKAPVHVTLNPRVQPAPPPSPIFSPGNKEPVKLSQSAYWVLRLPFVYEGDSGPYILPKEPVPADVARLLCGVYGVVEQASMR